MNIAVSACLLGEACRYDGASKPCGAVAALAADPRHTVVPVCPETLGGLRVPRVPCEVVTAERALRVVSAIGEDLTDAYLEGARRAVEAVQAAGCRLAILKSKSPACGTGRTYDGTFTRMLVPGYGVAARALREAGIRAMDEERFAACVRASEERHPGHRPALLAAAAAECPALETDRLVLRPLTLDDVPAVFERAHDPAIGADAGWPTHRTLADTRRFLYEVASAPHVFGIFEKVGRGGVKTGTELDPNATESSDSADRATGPCIGCIGLSPDPHRSNPDCLMLGYWVGRDAWGRGIATEAARAVVAYGFEELGLALISVTHYPQNARSRRVIEKCGFRREGVMRAAEPHVTGLPGDIALYSLTLEEWRAAR